MSKHQWVLALAILGVAVMWQGARGGAEPAAPPAASELCIPENGEAAAFLIAWQIHQQAPGNASTGGIKAENTAELAKRLLRRMSVEQRRQPATAAALVVAWRIYNAQDNRRSTGVAIAEHVNDLARDMLQDTGFGQPIQ